MISNGLVGLGPITGDPSTGTLRAPHSPVAFRIQASFLSQEVAGFRHSSHCHFGSPFSVAWRTSQVSEAQVATFIGAHATWCPRALRLSALYPRAEAGPRGQFVNKLASSLRNLPFYTELLLLPVVGWHSPGY